jgi:multidrug efflux pump subunit AcrB
MIDFLKNNKVVILILSIFILILGIRTLFTIPKEPTPSLNMPFYIMSVIYPGADPSTVEQQVIRKFENKLRSISYVKHVTSSSASNFWIISIEFLKQKKDVDAVNDIKSVIDQVYPTLSSDVKYPTFKKVDIADSPIYTFAIWSSLPTQKLYEKVKTLEDNIKWIQWVSDIITIWKPVEQININIDYNKLINFNLDITNVINILKWSLFKFPADKKDIKWSLYTFEISNYNDNIEDIINKLSELNLINIEWKAVKVKDISTIIFTYAYNKNRSFLVTDNWTVNTLSLQVKKIPWEDIEKITNNVKLKIDNFKKENPTFSIVETSSMKEATDKMYWTFMESFFETALLVFIIIFFVFWFKASLVILISFLISYSITFWYLRIIWYTFNNIVSFSLILVLGIMIDNLIVMMQWIIAWYKSWLRNSRDAVWYSIKNYWKAVTYWTFTTIAAFAPLYWMLSGIIWEFMKPFPITVDSNLFFSIITSIIILPIIFVYIFKTENTNFKTPKISDLLDKFWEKLWVFFTIINKTRKRSFAVVLSFWWLFFFSIWLMATGFINVDFMPPADSDNVWINMKYKAWITIDENQKYTKEISDKIVWFLNKKYKKEIDSISIELWSQKTVNAVAWAFSAWWANYSISSMTLRLIPWSQRNIKSYTITDDIQNLIMSEIKWKYEFIDDIYALTQKGGPWAWKAVWFNIVWDNVEEIGKYISEILPEIEKINWIYNIATSIEYSNWKIKYTIDDDKAKQLWININSVIFWLLALKNSEYEPNWIKIKWLNEFWDNEIEIKAFLDYNWEIDNLKIWNWYLNQIIKKIELKPDMKSLDKIDWQLAITIDADKKNEVPLWIVTSEIDKIIAKHPMPKWINYKAAWDIEDQMNSMKDLWSALLIWLMLMYLILIWLFKNFKYPTIVMTSIFLCIWWVFLILAITWLTFSFPAQLAIFWVLWVWVNQAIIHIIDFQEFHEIDWLSVIDSFKKSIAKRFEPIFLTKITTIIWLLILAMKDEVFWWMAIAFIWWLLMSFFVTLIYIPSLVRLTSKRN